MKKQSKNKIPLQLILNILNEEKQIMY